jgi:hypothetical protein
MKRLSIRSSKDFLEAVVILWFIIAVIGQLIFAAYTVMYYGRATISGQLEKWNDALPKGYVAGDNMGNVIVGMHLFLTAIIILGGPLQLIPKLRNYARGFHRWNERLYTLIAFIMSIGGLYMVWVRGSIGGTAQHISISINAILIMIASIFVIKEARNRHFNEHRIWAIRLFLFVNGVWFFRVGLFFWLFINQAPVGFDPKTFQGPFLTFLSFSQYLLPLALFELYIKSQRVNRNWLNYLTAFMIILATIVIAIGIVSISQNVWFPKMN